MLPNGAALWIARRRAFQPLLARLGSKTATFKVINEIRIEIPLQDQTGPGFYLNFGGPQAFYHYEEAEKLEIVRAMPREGVFLDIGANIGLFSTYVSKLLPQARCYAFEPSALLAECIRRTCRLSPFPRIEVQELCLSDREGTVDLHMHRKNSGGNSIIEGNIGTAEQGAALSVKSLTMDTWVSQAQVPRVDVIKIDVQGAEMLVLRGGKKTIERYKPTLLIEIENPNLIPAGTEWRKLLQEMFAESYSVRVAGAVSGFPISEIGKIAAEELGRGFGHTNYVFTRRDDRS